LLTGATPMSEGNEMRTCQLCGTVVQEDWRDCPVCSAPVVSLGNLWHQGPAVIPGPMPMESRFGWVPVPPQPTRKFPTGWRLAVLTTAILVLLGAVAAVSVDEVQTHEQLNSTRHTLAYSKNQLSSTRAQLNDSTSKLASAQSEIQSLQSSISNDQGVIGAAADVITLLKNCLDGVSVPLNDDLAGDYTGGSAAILSVEGTCQEANSAVAAHQVDETRTRRPQMGKYHSPLHLAILPNLGRDD
jgi:hypothetical protein